MPPTNGATTLRSTWSILPGCGSYSNSNRGKAPQKSIKKALIGASKQAEVPVKYLEKNVVERVERKLSDQISLEFNSPRHITPPDSPHLYPTSPPILQLEASTEPTAPQDGDVTMQLVRSRGKRHRVEPFHEIVSKARPRALPGLATSNYFSVLSSMEVELEEVDVVANPEHGKGFQIIPIKARMPKQLAVSKEAAHFYRKRHTTVEKTDGPTRVGQVGELMEIDSTNALQRIKPDKLVQADAHIKLVRKLVRSCTSSDKIIQAAVEHPITMHGMLFACMDSNDSVLDELAHILMINRVFAANNLNEDVTFATRWTSAPAGLQELTRAAQPIAFIELFLMCVAPTLYTNDHWIHYLTGAPVLWVPAHHCRLFHTNVLLSLFRSEVGAHCVGQWFEGNWRGDLCLNVEELHSNPNNFPEEISTLHLSVRDGEARLTAGPLVHEC
uniref:AlNc14C81G5294 protein n=1 Tax=Albugo laibachii Nc14 TaxID=890382 RepID=F0WFA2_9STRA|nr:AlNc14C81G5294 [Albugo laibachii Nc14]|eukprot:CCA19884.1 AlNc14C81G5294 [Albugo laibachii Nc14]